MVNTMCLVFTCRKKESKSIGRGDISPSVSANRRKKKSSSMVKKRNLQAKGGYLCKIEEEEENGDACNSME